jgi:hypothetical protein
VPLRKSPPRAAKSRVNAVMHAFWINTSLKFFDVSYVDAPNKRTTRGESKPDTMHMLLTHREQLPDDLGGVADVASTIENR